MATSRTAMAPAGLGPSHGAGFGAAGAVGHRLLGMGIVLLAVVALHAAVAAAQNLPVVGWIEPVRILPADVVVMAKLDSGADNSSLHAREIERFERAGESWVRFDLVGESGKRATIEAPLVRTAQIKRFRGATIERPVIRLALCLGSARREVEVNLQDRTGLSQRMLVGRSFLAGVVLLDSGRERLTQPDCARNP